MKMILSKYLCSKEVPNLTVRVPSKQRRLEREPFLLCWQSQPWKGWVFSPPYLQPCYHICAWARASYWGLCFSGGSVLGLQPGDWSNAGSSSFFWAYSCFPSKRPRGLPGFAHRGLLELKVKWCHFVLVAAVVHPCFWVPVASWISRRL